MEKFTRFLWALVTLSPQWVLALILTYAGLCFLKENLLVSGIFFGALGVVLVNAWEVTLGGNKLTKGLSTLLFLVTFDFMFLGFLRASFSSEIPSASMRVFRAAFFLLFGAFLALVNYAGISSVRDDLPGAPGETHIGK